MTLLNYVYYVVIKRIKQFRLLYYIEYDEKNILDMLTREVGWQDYGGKHHESKYTGFFQSYILTRKFNIDKRKLHFSALIRSGQMTREQALEKVKEDPYLGGVETFNYCLKKLEFTNEEFEKIMNQRPKMFLEYKTYYSLVRFLKKPVKWGSKIGVIPDTVYRKFFRFNI
jgi:hypothetical protein